jgi:uncharacterized protein (DUF1810 family)
MDDPYRLGRFVSAQDGGGAYADALAELRAGQKVSHWMWFVFPQLAGLGSSPMAQQYGITGQAEARAYLAHPVLRERLLAAAQALLAVEGRSITSILGYVDTMKLRSSMTLFAAVEPDEPTFGQVLDKYFHGQADDLTLSMLGQR